MKTCLMMIILTLLICCNGCSKQNQTPTAPPAYNIQKNIAEAKEKVVGSSASIKEATQSISAEATTIKQEAVLVENKIPEEIKPIVDAHLTKIDKSTDSIIKNTKQIEQANLELISATNLLSDAKDKVRTTEEALVKITDERDQAIKERDKAIADRDSQMHNTLRWIIVACIVGAGVFGVIAVMYGSKVGMVGAAICGVVLAIAVFVEAYFAYLAIAGGIILLGLVVVVIYNIWMQKKALKETIDTVEVVKLDLSADKKKELFGGDGQTRIMDSIQSPSTIEIINKTHKG